MTDDGVVEAGVDFERANAARMYDYLLGGAHNFAVDRELGDRVMAANPAARAWARGNRAFLMRAVRYCVEQGVRQFLDLGSGIPTVDHVHTTARAIAPDSRVAYVDFEPIAVAHSRELLADLEGVTITAADIRHPATVLGAPTVTRLVDFSRPVAVLAVALMHFVPDDEDPAGILASYRAACAPGSFLAVSHASADYDDADVAAAMDDVTALYRRSATPGFLRSRQRIRELFGDVPLVEPGLVDMARWRGDPGAAELGSYAAVASLG